MALAILLTIQIADAQVKTPADAKKAVETAAAATENPKKAAKPATWIKLANAYMDAYTAPMGNGWVGANKQELTFIMANEKPSSTETVTLAGEQYSKETYATMNYYFNANNQLALIEVTKPVYADALDKALDAYIKAAEVDAKGSKVKDIDAGIKNISAKFVEEGMNNYMLGDLKAASTSFEKAVNASESSPTPSIDTMAVYNAGFTAWMTQDYAKAEPFFKRCLDLGYAEDGEVYAKLADIYSNLDKKEDAKSILEQGFAAFPQNQSIIIGLINYYIESGEQPDELFALLRQSPYGDCFDETAVDAVEEYYQRAVFRFNKRQLSAVPPSIYTAIAYLELKELELGVLVNVIESVKYGVPYHAEFANLVGG